MKRIFALIFAIPLLLMFAACGDTNSNGDTTDPAETTASEPVKEYHEQIIDIADAKYKSFGRTTMIGKSITCDWSASGIEFNADCKGDVYINITTDNPVNFTAYIDGKRAENTVSAEKSGSFRLKVASELPEGVHTIKFLRQTSANYSKTMIDSIELCGELLDPPADRDLYIEFYGDSITCGWAMHAATDATPEVANQIQYQDGTLTYAHLAAEAVGADSSIMAIAGAGLVEGCSVLIPDLYPYINKYRSTTEYTFERKPDIVVINLGTNDSSKPASSKFLPEARDFVKQIREDGDDPIIIWAGGVMFQYYYEAGIKRILDGLGREEAGYYMVELPRGQSGGRYHPNAAENEAAAKVLAEFIEKVIADNNLRAPA